MKDLFILIVIVLAILHLFKSPDPPRYQCVNGEPEIVETYSQPPDDIHF